MTTKIVKIEDLIEITEFRNLYVPQPNDELVRSYQEKGQLTPIQISERNEIINGYRMVDAIKKAGGTTVEAIIRNGVPTLYDRIILNQYREKTIEDKIMEVKEVFNRFPKRQGKKLPYGERYVRHEKISESLNNRWKGDDIIKKLEHVIKSDLEGDVLLKKIVNNQSGVDTCYDFLTEKREIDHTNNYGFTEKIISGELTVRDVNKLITQRKRLDKYECSFKIPNVGHMFNMNCVELSKMEEYRNMVDLILTSPPYYDLRRYINGDEYQIGHELKKEEYCENITRIISQLIPTLKETANVIINIGESYEDGVGYGIPRSLTNCIEKETTLIYKDMLVWSKPNPKPQNENVKRPINNLEYLLWFVVDKKKAKYNLLTYPVNGKTAGISHGAKDVDSNGTIWDKNISISKPYGKIYSHLKEQEVLDIIECSVGRNHDVYQISKAGHPAIMSSLLPVIPILMTTDEGDTVLDPFAGTSVVGRMSCLLNRRTLATELSKEYFNIGCKMLETAVEEFDRSSLDFIQNEFYQNDNSNNEQLQIAA